MPAPSGSDYVSTTKSNSTRSIAAHPAYLGLLHEWERGLPAALTVGEIGALSDLDDVTVRIADVAAYLAILRDRLGGNRGQTGRSPFFCEPLAAKMGSVPSVPQIHPPDSPPSVPQIHPQIHQG
jgi:hypothetical protein